MADSKTQKISIGEIIKDPKTLDFVPEHLKNKKMCNQAVKMLPLLLQYVRDRCNAKQMC